MNTSELVTNYLKPYVLSEISISDYSKPIAVIVTLYTYGYNVNLFGKASFLMETSVTGSISTSLKIEDGVMFRGDGTNVPFIFALCALLCSSLWLIYKYSRLCVCSSSVFEVVTGFGSLFTLIYDTVLSIMTIVTMGLVVALYVRKKRFLFLL